MSGYTHRYQETNGTYILRTFETGGSLTGWTTSAPDWVQLIVTLAKMGNHVSTPPAPPDFIVWFTTDSKFNLTGFIDLKDT